MPARLAELLVARAGWCGQDGRAVLAALAVARRPLTEDQLGGVSGLAAEAVRRGLQELATARLLADTTVQQGHRPRHALLAEAVAADMLPGERVVLHERTARLLGAAGGDSLAAEVASHWQAAGRAAEELPARVAAAGAAERVFGYAEAAAHWERAIELCQALPGAAGTAGASVCPGCTCGPSTRPSYPATRSTPASWPRRLTGSSPATPTTPLPRSFASAPGICEASTPWAPGSADGKGARAVRAGRAVGRTRRGATPYGPDLLAGCRRTAGRTTGWR